MAININIREELPEDAVIFSYPAFDNSIIGVGHNGAVIYSYDLMVEEYMKDEDASYFDAVDFIDYNTLGSSPPPGIGEAPIVMYGIIA